MSGRDTPQKPPIHHCLEAHKGCQRSRLHVLLFHGSPKGAHTFLDISQQKHILEVMKFATIPRWWCSTSLFGAIEVSSVWVGRCLWKKAWGTLGQWPVRMIKALLLLGLSLVFGLLRCAQGSCLHGCCWETFCVLTDCGLVVEIQFH